MAFLITLGVIYLACLGVFLWSVVVAPEGYEDDAGFHLQDDEDASDHDSEHLHPTATA